MPAEEIEDAAEALGNGGLEGCGAFGYGMRELDPPGVQALVDDQRILRAGPGDLELARRSRRSGFRHSLAGSPQRPGESRSSSYGPMVHLRLLPTPPHGDAVTLGYRPESACLGETSTPLIEYTLRRISAGRTRPVGGAPAFGATHQGWRHIMDRSKRLNRQALHGGFGSCAQAVYRGDSDRNPLREACGREADPGTIGVPQAAMRNSWVVGR